MSLGLASLLCRPHLFYLDTPLQHCYPITPTPSDSVSLCDSDMPGPIMDCLCPTAMWGVLGGSLTALSCFSQSCWVWGVQEKCSHLGQPHVKLMPHHSGSPCLRSLEPRVSDQRSAPCRCLHLALGQIRHRCALGRLPPDAASVALLSSQRQYFSSNCENGSS